ncbi:Crp/Fnr family transcriptional regulator [Reichenbachiella ulvae]|uniref:Crp/Fnr family transcriptional regulator n=1 Tax=Reichenbachiella ulvae TaxID=2980104 RepID=A0ABT3D028_9BACT|nr:Crp/Fnr family transcriptional regulator [Reichenbachiella ulvae]MCV9389169.1 Crp/Fnr family transcriptional regulator [Reichenbachiella ulvae]
MTQQQEEYLEDYLKQYSHSSQEELDYIRPHLSFQELKKGEFYLQRGETQTQMGFVSFGLLRRYYVNEKANEITTGFVKENEFVTDYPAFIRQIPSNQNLQCLEPTLIINLPYSIIQECYDKFKNSERNGRLIAEKVLTILSDRVEGFLFNTAEERYLQFLKDHPDLMNRVSLTHLSSFLGIERQSLSRIRKNLTQR